MKVDNNYTPIYNELKEIVDHIVLHYAPNYPLNLSKSFVIWRFFDKIAGLIIDLVGAYWWYMMSLARKKREVRKQLKKEDTSKTSKVNTFGFSSSNRRRKRNGS